MAPNCRDPGLAALSDGGPVEAAIQRSAQSRHASGFIYCVSVTGVTGARSSVSGDAKGYVASIRKVTDLPVGVGFGISTPAQAKEVAKYADAVIVGSAIVNVIAKNPANRKKLVEEVKKFVSALRAAMDS